MTFPASPACVLRRRGGEEGDGAGGLTVSSERRSALCAAIARDAGVICAKSTRHRRRTSGVSVLSYPKQPAAAREPDSNGGSGQLCPAGSGLERAETVRPAHRDLPVSRRATVRPGGHPLVQCLGAQRRFGFFLPPTRRATFWLIWKRQKAQRVAGSRSGIVALVHHNETMSHRSRRV